MGTPLNSRMTRSMYATVKDRSAEVAKRRREAEMELRRKRAERIKELEEKAMKAVERKRQSLVEKYNKGRDAEHFKEINQRRAEREKEEIERRKSLLEKKSNQISAVLPPKARISVAFGSAVKDRRINTGPSLMTSSCHPAFNGSTKVVTRPSQFEKPRRPVEVKNFRISMAKNVKSKEQEKRPFNSVGKVERASLKQTQTKAETKILTKEVESKVTDAQHEPHEIISEDNLPSNVILTAKDNQSHWNVDQSSTNENVSIHNIAHNEKNIDAMALKETGLEDLVEGPIINDDSQKFEAENPSGNPLTPVSEEMHQTIKLDNVIEQNMLDTLSNQHDSIVEESIDQSNAQEVLAINSTAAGNAPDYKHNVIEYADVLPENGNVTENESGFETSSEKMGDIGETLVATDQLVPQSPQNTEDGNRTNSTTTTSSTPNSELNGLIGQTVKLRQERSNRRAMMNEILSKTRDNASPVPAKSMPTVENSELLKSILSRRHFNDHNDTLSSTKTDSLPLRSDVPQEPNEQNARVIENEFYKLSIKSASDNSFLLPGQLAEAHGVSQ